LTWFGINPAIKASLCFPLLLFVCFVLSGKDATEDFDEIGHSRAAKEMLAKYYIGDYAVSGSSKLCVRLLLRFCLQCTQMAL
jgi:hypothetical protein